MEKMIVLKTQCIKYLALSLFIWAFVLPVVAGNETDTIIYREKNNSKWYVIRDGMVFKNKKYYSDFHLDFGHNRLDKSNMFTGTTHESASGFPKLRNSASTSFAMYAMFGCRISGSLSIMSGLGIDWVNYRFSKDVTIREINDMATQVSIESIIPSFSFMKKSKLTGSYLEVPLLLKLRFRRFFVAAGVTGGLNIGSHTKVVFVDMKGKKQTYKDYDIHLAPFRYGYTVRAGFRFLSLFTNYYVSPLFAKDEGPQVYPFAMGISLKLW
jgi:hypothetical protein